MGPSALLGYSVIPTTTSIFQQRENTFTPRLLRIVYPPFAVLSALAKVAFSLAGTFLLSSVHPGGLFILFVDYLGVAAWFWWMVGQSTLARAKLQYISCYLSVMALLLLVVAIIGTLGESWIIALEIELFIIAISTPSLQSAAWAA
ncbi:hypothetical protein PENARI_c049G06489 [Penicillium arizonense]|uniref:Uncharacterized protein n=1 Tax=Penicillium arizonense TaxID=1835702 RepID=A0A1F5L2T9_PENAI|nr:hypothetical protein PENARI_c049G06489 [Penicillium arizonense]OGE47320.1 hypothetical protein PENARI_c049G06489 [Penicillium arizonense]